MGGDPETVTVAQVSLVDERLRPDHDVGSFTCGVDSLDTFLRKHARSHPAQGLSRTWVLARGVEVLSFYTLAIGSLVRASATERVGKGMPNHDLPILLIARLAVDKKYQGQGLGAVTLEFALRRAMSLAGHKAPSADAFLPFRAVVVHAIDENAAAFYEHHGFARSPHNPLHLMILTKDLAAILSASEPKDA